MNKEIPNGLIEKYVEGSLKGEELESFEKRMKEDSSIANEVQLYKELKEGLGDPTFNKLEQVTSKLGNDYFKSDTPSKNKNKSLHLNRRAWIAAAVLIGLVAGLWYFFNPNTISGEQLYTQYAKHDFSFTQLNNPTLLNQIEASLKAEKFNASLDLIEDYLNQYPNDPDILIAKGVCLLEIGKEYDKALDIFASIKEVNPIYTNEGLWYEALTYLKTDDIIKAIDRLEKIPPPSDRYSNAQAIIAKLKS